MDESKESKAKRALTNLEKIDSDTKKFSIFTTETQKWNLRRFSLFKVKLYKNIYLMSQ